MMLYRWLLTNGDRTQLLIRVLAGWVFLSEGIQKFLFPEALGVGRFAKIGIPAPELLAPFVGGVEILGGALLLLGLLARPAAIALILDISVAILTTKLPMLLHDGFWKAAHEARVDFSMLFACLFVLIRGAGGLSVDNSLTRKV